LAEERESGKGQKVVRERDGRDLEKERRVKGRGRGEKERVLAKGRTT